MNIAVLDDYQGQAHTFADWGSLPAGMQVRFFEQVLEGEALIEALAGVQVIVAMRERTPFPAAVLARLPDLKLLVTTGMRNAAIDMQACKAQGVLVCGTDSPGTPTAELTWALILALFKRVVSEDAALRRGDWQTDIPESVQGKVLGVVGLGKLGARVARIGQAFGMDTIAWSPNLDDARAQAAGVRRVGKQELFAQADVVSLHLVLSERSQGIVGAAELGAMKPSAYLINTARAGLIDEAALLRTLSQGAIAGAGLDVFSQEPLPADHPLTRLPGVVLTPHLGYVNRESYAVYFSHALEDILAWRAGQPLRVLNG